MTRVTIVVAVVATLVIALVMTLSGCTDACASHGGVRSQGGGWTYCNDGTQVAGYL